MSNLEEHEAEQAEITALCEAGECDHPECHAAPLDWRKPVTIDDSDNSTRALRALQTIYPAYDDDGAETAVRDVLADLRHLCDLMGWSFAELSGQAHTVYLRELSECGAAAENPDLKASIERDIP